MVGADRALGEPGSEASTASAIRALQEATVAMALETIGTADALFALVLAYVKDRQQFGVPIGSFQAVKHKMANMFVALERARALCYFAVAAIEENAEDRPTAVAMAKAASDDAQQLVCRGFVPVLRRHRVHLGTRQPPLHKAGADHGHALRGHHHPHGGVGRGSRRRSQRLTQGADTVLTGASLIDSLRLEPHPEGGWYRRTWVAESDGDERPSGSAILYLLARG